MNSPSQTVRVFCLFKCSIPKIIDLVCYFACCYDFYEFSITVSFFSPTRLRPQHVKRDLIQIPFKTTVQQSKLIKGAYKANQLSDEVSMISKLISNFILWYLSLTMTMLRVYLIFQTTTEVLIDEFELEEILMLNVGLMGADFSQQGPDMRERILWVYDSQHVLMGAKVMGQSVKAVRDNVEGYYIYIWNDLFYRLVYVVIVNQQYE